MFLAVLTHLPHQFQEAQVEQLLPSLLGACAVLGGDLVDLCVRLVYPSEQRLELLVSQLGILSH